MSGRVKAHAAKIDQLMEQASAELAATRAFEAERTAVEALRLAHQSQDFNQMTRILMPLQEARRLRRQQACDVKKVHRVSTYEALESLLNGSVALKPGCYLLEPPLVGADARELRERGLAERIPVLVVAREPETRLGQWPVVTVGPLTVRTRLAPPKKLDASWIQAAAEAIGEAAIAQLDPEESAESRVEHAMDLLAAVVDHERLHQVVRSICEEAHRDAVEFAARPLSRRKQAKRDEEELESLGDADL